jgi:hypothetical protein
LVSFAPHASHAHERCVFTLVVSASGHACVRVCAYALFQCALENVHARTTQAMKHVHYEDENTRYVDIGPVSAGASAQMRAAAAAGGGARTLPAAALHIRSLE